MLGVCVGSRTRAGGIRVHGRSGGGEGVSYNLVGIGKTSLGSWCLNSRLTEVRGWATEACPSRGHSSRQFCVSQEEQESQCGSNGMYRGCIYRFHITTLSNTPWEENRSKEIPFLDPPRCGQNRSESWGESYTGDEACTVHWWMIRQIQATKVSQLIRLAMTLTGTST